MVTGKCLIDLIKVSPYVKSSKESKNDNEKVVALTVTKLSNSRVYSFRPLSIFHFFNGDNSSLFLNPHL
jgi:hypothetical protein